MGFGVAQFGPIQPSKHAQVGDGHATHSPCPAQGISGIPCGYGTPASASLKGCDAAAGQAKDGAAKDARDGAAAAVAFQAHVAPMPAKAALDCEMIKLEPSGDLDAESASPAASARSAHHLTAGNPPATTGSTANESVLVSAAGKCPHMPYPEGRPALENMHRGPDIFARRRAAR